MPSSPLVRSVYGLLVVATIAAFFVTQRLKSDEPVVLRFAATTKAISPNGDGVADYSVVGFDLSEDARASFDVIDERGDEVRTLVPARDLEGDEKHRFAWDGRDDDGTAVPDGPYRLQVTLRDEGRTLRSEREVRVDTSPPRPRLAFAKPNLISPGIEDSPRLVEIAYRGPKNAAPEYRIFRTDGGEPRVVQRFRGSDTKSAFWDGRLRGHLAPEGNYAFNVSVRDRAGNLGRGPAGARGPTAATALPGTGVVVRRLTLRGPLTPVEAGDTATFTVGPSTRRKLRFRFALTRLGSPKVLRGGSRRGPNLRVEIPPRAETGLHVLRIKSGRQRTSTPVAVQAGPAGGRPLVVIPAITWQGLNEEDDDFDGFGDTLLAARSVRLARPFLGGLPPLFGRELAPLMRFLDRARIEYDLTTDLALAREEGPSLNAATGVAVAGSARWLPEALNVDLREYVERGRAVASFGSDAFRRRVRLGESSLDGPGRPDGRNVFGEAVRPAPAATEAPFNVIDDELGLFSDTDRLFGLFSTFEESEGLPRGAALLSSAGRDANSPAFVAYRLGGGTVIRVGAPGWSDALEGVNEDDEVGRVTEAIFAELAGEPRLRYAKAAVSMIAAAPLLSEAGILACALGVAGAFVLRDPRARAICVLVALAVTPLLLLGDLWDSPQIESLRDRPAVSLAAAALGLAAAGSLAALFLRRPRAFPVLAVAALPFRVPVEAGGDTFNLLVPLYVVVAAGALAYSWRRLSDDPPPEREPGAIELALLFMVGVYAVQAAYSTDFDKALENVVFFYVPFALLLKLLSTIDWTPRLLQACLGVAVGLAIVFVLIGFWEYGTRRLLLNPDVLEANLFKDYFRVNSLFFDPNIYGRFLAIVMIAVAGVMLWAERRRDALWAAALLALLWAGLLLTFSQSSFASLLVGLGVLGLLRWRARPLQLAAGATLLAIVATGLAVSGALNFDPFREGSLNRATSGRIELLESGLTMFWERPLQGFGSGSYNERFVEREEVSEERADAASHTIPVTIAAEQGLIGLFSYALVLYAIASVLFGGLGRLRERGPPPWWLSGRAVLAAAFAALVFHTLAYAASLEDPITWALLGIAIGLASEAPLPTTAAERAAARMRTRAV